MLDVKMTTLRDTYVTLSHASKNHVCGSATCAWDWCSVCSCSLTLSERNLQFSEINAQFRVEGIRQWDRDKLKCHNHRLRALKSSGHPTDLVTAPASTWSMPEDRSSSMSSSFIADEVLASDLALLLSRSSLSFLSHRTCRIYRVFPRIMRCLARALYLERCGQPSSVSDSPGQCRMARTSLYGGCRRDPRPRGR